MGNIVLLDDLTINKIAAGEVIERPASVVKEMVENSIDAGATQIIVEIKNGGISFIRITDNGKGIKDDDIEIAFERHATSKIRTSEDISKITSMGFRGEALASIAAIANVQMVSRTQESAIGSKIVVEGGKVLERTIAGCGIGTSITVTNLFFNTPVRYKFLKKDFTESGYIEDVITRLALVNRNIAFKLINNGKTVVQTNGDGETKSVIYSIYGKDVAEAILDVEYELNGITVSGVIGKPEICRSNRSHQIFFVNGRYIKDKTLSAAAEQAFKGLIPINKYGFLILNIKINPELVDVNVHPAKLEVRFEEEDKVFKSVYHAIKSGLAKGELVENVVKEKEEEITKLSRGKHEYVEEANEDTTKEEITEIKPSKEELEQNDKIEKVKEKLFAKKFKNLFNKKEEKTDVEVEEIDNSNENKEEKLEEINQFRSGLKELGISEAEPNAVYDINKIIEENKYNSRVENYDEADKVEETEEEYSKEDTTNEEIVDNSSENQELEENIVEEQEIEDPEENNIDEEQEVENPEENDINEEQKIENSEEYVEQEIETDESNKEDFGDMYKKIFGASVSTNNEPVERKELTENEREVLEDIKKKALLNNSNEEVSEEPKVEEVDDEESNDLDDKVEFLRDDTTEVTDEKLPIEDIIINNENSEKMPEFRDMDSNSYKFIGIAFDTYIIIEFLEEMYIIDQHAAHERIMYEKVKENYYSSDDKDSQLMLLPDVISLTHKEAELVKENLSMFEKAGFTLEEFGENTIKLTGVPNICMEMNTKQLFMELIDEINNFSRTALQEREDRFIATIACKAAVKGKMKLDKSEVKKLLDQLLELPNPFTCPHGRPTAIKYTKYDLERKFSRK
ncbi:MAG: DNA mismatch repair endonuclease MutL [Clostridia bacterium]|nr:DNA mismatch repair endonuclease MutL [Clostridia bacterium]